MRLKKLRRIDHYLFRHRLRHNMTPMRIPRSLPLLLLLLAYFLQPRRKRSLRINLLTLPLQREQSLLQVDLSGRLVRRYHLIPIYSFHFSGCDRRVADLAVVEQAEKQG